MKKVTSFAKKAAWFISRAIAAGVLPAIGAYYWTASNHDNYWNKTIFAVQTIDFKILAHTLPTKLSTLLIRQDKTEIQKTLNSSTGRFGMVVTDCKVEVVECLGQNIIYKTDSRSTWSTSLTVDSLKDAPFDLLLDPPPTKAEIDFLDIRSDKFTVTGAINQGKPIGRVYYVRGIPPSYIDSWERWLRDPLTGVGPVYATSVITFLTFWILLIVSLEIVLNRIKAKSHQNQQLMQQLEGAQEKIIATLKDKSKVLADLRKAEEEQQSLLAHLQHSVSNAETSQTSLEDAKETNSELQIELQHKLDQSAGNLTSYEKELQSNTEYIDDLKKTIVFQKEHLVPQSDIEAYQQNLNEANSNQARLLELIEAKNHDIRVNQQDLQFLNEEKIDLETKLTDVDSKLSSSKIRVDTLESDIQGLEALISKSQADKEQVEHNAEELKKNLESLSLDKKNLEVKLEGLTAQVKSDSDHLEELYEQELKDKENALISNKKIYEDYTKDLKEEIALLNSKNEDLECDLISARSDRDYFASQHLESAEVSSVDISALHIGFVGGHSKTMNRVVTRLQRDYGLINYVLLEAGYNHNQNIFRSKLKNCNLIVLISSYAGHHYFYMLQNLQTTGAITEEMIILSRAAESGIVREVINYCKSLDVRASA